ncbi:MAG: 3-phenylpropionate/cinnamic acid dioxygenase subunit beta [Aquisalimonadaceae bacterium]
MEYAFVRGIEQFLYREARLLDEGKFQEWLDLFTDDVRYWMPMKTTRDATSSAETTDKELAFFDDRKPTLSLRVKRLTTGMAFAEDPPSRTRRIISNIEIDALSDKEVEVYSNFLVYRTRLESVEDTYVGHRKDVLKEVDGSWKIAQRKMIIEQNVLASNNLSVFF